MRFLTNPKSTTRKTKRKGRFAKGSKAAKAWGRKMKALRSGKGGSTVAKKRTKKRTTKRKATTKRTYRKNPARSTSARKVSRRRRYKRNPGMGGKLGGVLHYLKPSALMGGLVDAVEVIAGEVVVRRVPGLVGLPTDGNMGLVVKVGVSIVAGGAAHAFVGSNAGKMVLAGALADTLKSAAKAFAPDLATSVLGEDTVMIDGMGTYPQVGMGSYVQPTVMGEQEYDYATVQ